jgi:hypothetical protein
MRKGFASLSLPVQEVLTRDPLGGHVFWFRGGRRDVLKAVWHDDQAANLYFGGWSGGASCAGRTLVQTGGVFREHVRFSLLSNSAAQICAALWILRMDRLPGKWL